MNTESESVSIDCRTCREQLPDLLLEDGYFAQHPEVAQHLAACDLCSSEVRELQSTFAALDNFTAPEPSAFFDTRLMARLRESQAAQPESVWERMRSFLLFSTGRTFRPAVTGALAAVLVLASGGAFLQLHHGLAPASAEASTTVNDLKVLDNNAQAEQQMGQLLDQSGDEDGDPAPSS